MKRTISITYKTITLISLLLGIILDLYGANVVIIASYFTLQSNIICCIFFFVILILEITKFKYKHRLYYILKGAISIIICLTMTIYHIKLEPRGFLMGGLTKKELADFFVHTFSPMLVILDYFLFEKKGNFKYYYPIFWIIFPALYVAYAYIYSYFGGRFYNVGGSVRYGYFFLDYHEIGVVGVIKWIFIILAFVLFISYTLVIYDKKTGNMQIK